MGARSGHRSGHPREGILRLSPAQVHASDLFSFMPSFEKKITLDKGTVGTTVENGNTLAVRFVCCVSCLSPLALKPSFTLERPTRWSQARSWPRGLESRNTVASQTFLLGVEGCLWENRIKVNLNIVTSMCHECFAHSQKDSTN